MTPHSRRGIQWNKAKARTQATTEPRPAACILTCSPCCNLSGSMGERTSRLGQDAETLDESATTVIAQDVLNQGKQARLDDWGKRYPTLVDDVALCVANMIEYEEENIGGLAGVWHCACTCEQFTKYRIALLMAGILGVSAAHLSGDPEPPKGAPRPRDTMLDCSDLDALGLLPKMTPLREALPEVLAPFKPL
mmetsp:Transcript_17498/g.48816  ORF Transcript_17498/g.48816 Transcript_17498/m.48816 type:complete len:193 (-) Transcript_17498:137-715(-)